MHICRWIPLTVPIRGGILALSGQANDQERNPRISPTTEDLLGVATAPGQTVAVGLAGTIVTSTDGNKGPADHNLTTQVPVFIQIVRL